MAKMACNLYLDKKTVSAIDEAAETLGMSRSQVADMMLAATLGDTSAADVVKAMFTSALAAKHGQKADETDFQPA